MILNVRRQFRTSKVPSINGVFWFLKILTTAMGEATSDYFVHHFAPVAAVFGAGVVFVVVLVWQLRYPRYSIIWYWLAVVMVSVFGTMCADVVHVGLGVPYVVSAVCFAVALTALFLSWYRVEGTLSIHSITSARRELFYWATITVTFALGTAVGDMTATTLKLGYFSSGLLFVGLFLVPAVAYRWFRVNAIGSFWACYILTRPLGASFADWMGVSHERGGLNWGNGNVALLFSTAIVIVVTFLVLRQRRRTNSISSLGWSHARHHR
ncbi:MAG: hypothetical protein ABSG09_00495 [Acidimicrobiales bacterium]|jgi:uncharacterized membrane-anchored protein